MFLSPLTKTFINPLTRMFINDRHQRLFKYLTGNLLNVYFNLV